jgi:HlyD family secretion protein
VKTHQKYLLVILPMLLVACTQRSATSAAKEEAIATPVEVAEVEIKPIHSVTNADAVLHPFQQSAIVPKISAPVQQFLVQRGDHVRKDQVVAVLESKDLASAAQESKQLYQQAKANFENTSSATMPDDLTRASSDVRSAEESLDASDKVYESRLKLYNEGALAQKLVEDAKVARVAAQSALDTARQHLLSLKTIGQSSQLQAARAQVEAAQAHYESSAVQLSYATIRSPIDGVVSDRPLNVGEMASAGSALMTIVDISRVVARANAPVSAASQVRVGQPAVITNGTSVTLNGKVVVVSPAVDPNTTTVQVWVEAANPGEKLKLGSTAHISITTGEIKAAVVVPSTALLSSDDGGEKVMIAGADSTAREQAVEVGVRTAEESQITKGLKAGQKVIVSGALGLDDKAKIQIIATGSKSTVKGEQ